MTTPTVADTLRLANGVTTAERDHVVEVMSRLDDRLRSFPAGSVELQLSVKERDTPSQRTTLEAWIAGQPRLVSTSDRPDLDAAVAEVRDDLIRLISDAKNRTEPRNNRALRDTL
ncbi:MAG: HPF/RaiA family ribosome-associated protein [Acidimicrobiales bacterium]